MATLVFGGFGSIIVIAGLLVALAGNAHGQSGYFAPLQGSSTHYYPSSGVQSWSIAERCKAPAPQGKARKVRR